MVDEAKPPEPVDYPLRGSATPGHRQFLDSLHMGEGYVLFGVDLEDVSKSEPDNWQIAVIEKGGASTRLSEAVVSKSDQLIALLGEPSTILTLRRWNEVQHLWDDPSPRFSIHADAASQQFEDLSLCYMQGSFVFGLLVCLVKDASYDTRLTALHNDGISKLLSVYEREQQVNRRLSL